LNLLEFTRIVWTSLRLCYVFSSYWEKKITKKLEVARVYSQNGEIHFILREYRADESFKNRKDFDEAKVKKIMKKEASKPLLLLREE
jgi:hypothetical protein